jgi:hypothetical protein
MFNGIRGSINDPNAPALFDPKAFIFSLTKGTVHYQRDKRGTSTSNNRGWINFGHRFQGESNWDDIAVS